MHNMSQQIDDLLKDPTFLASPEYAYLKTTADEAEYASVKELMLDFIDDFKRDDEESAAIWFDEVKVAVDADSAGKVFPPLHRVASYIRRKGFQNLSEEHIFVLADFLEGTHRNKRGRPQDEYASEILQAYEERLGAGDKPTNAVKHIAEREKLDDRTVQRIISRAKRRRDNSELFKQISQIDMAKYFQKH